MSNVLLAADATYRRYVSANEGSVPPVKVIHALGETQLNGLKLHPCMESGMVAFGPAGYSLPVFVMKQEDVHQVVLGEVTAKFGFDYSD